MRPAFPQNPSRSEVPKILSHKLGSAVGDLRSSSVLLDSESLPAPPETEEFGTGTKAAPTFPTAYGSLRIRYKTPQYSRSKASPKCANMLNILSVSKFTKKWRRDRPDTNSLSRKFMREDFSNINSPSCDFKTIAGSGSTIDLFNLRNKGLESQGASVSEIEHFSGRWARNSNRVIDNIIAVLLK